VVIILNSSFLLGMFTFKGMDRMWLVCYCTSFVFVISVNDIGYYGYYDIVYHSCLYYGYYDKYGCSYV
jgi:hypothetical protein